MKLLPAVLVYETICRVELIGLIKGMKIQSYYLSFLITSYNVCEFKENESQHKHKQKRCLNMMGCVFIKDLFVKHWYHFLKEVWFHKGDEWILKTECIEKNRMSYSMIQFIWKEVTDILKIKHLLAWLCETVPSLRMVW